MNRDNVYTEENILAIMLQYLADRHKGHHDWPSRYAQDLTTYLGFPVPELTELFDQVGKDHHKFELAQGHDGDWQKWYAHEILTRLRHIKYRMDTTDGLSS